MKRFIPIKYYISIVKDKLKEELKCYNTRPHLGAIYFGDNPASDSYIKGIKKDCDELGYEFTLRRNRRFKPPAIFAMTMRLFGV